MAIKVQGTTVIDDSRNIINIGIATVGALDVNKISSDGIDYGQANYVLTSGGPSGDISWKLITDVGAGILDAVFIRQNGSNVGSGTATTFDFYENFSLTQPSAGIASVRLANTLNIGGLNVTGISTFTGAVNFGTSAYFGDGDILNFGDSNDLQIYHTTASGTYITDEGAGDLYIRTSKLNITDTGNNLRAVFDTNTINGGVQLYYGTASKKFETTGYGATVFGTLQTQQLNVSGVSTFAGITTVTGNTLFAKQLNVSGVATATTFIGSLTGTATSTTNIPNLSGDVSSNNTITTLATVNSNVGTYGGTGAIPVVTVNAKGLVTGVSTVAPNNGTLTLSVSGTGLSGSATFTANQSGNSTFTVTSNATSDNTNNAIVSRNASGGFSAGIITATQFSTGAGTIGITTNTISGPAELTIDPAAVGDNTGSVRIKGDLYVDGTQFIVNSSTIELADFNVGIATTVGTNALLDGAGIGIGSTGIRKTITWNNTAGALTSSEDWNLVSDKQYEINGTSVLNATTLGSGVVNSSLTSVGTLGQLNVSGNLGIGTTNPTTKLEVNGVLGFGTFNYNGTRTNIRIGDNTTGASITDGYDNIFMGIGAGNFTTTGNWNNFIARAAGKLTTTGFGNNFFGFAGGYNNTTGKYNSFFGDSSGYYNSIGNNNAFFGSFAGLYNSTGNFNTFFGTYTGLSTSSSNRVIIGSGYQWSPTGLFDAPDTNKDTQFAVGIRTSSAPSKYWLVGDENFNVGIGTTNPTTKLEVGGVLGFGPGNNVRIGDNTTGASISSGTNNNFMGVGAGNSNTTGYGNNFFGPLAGYNNNGSFNNFFGDYAGYANTTGKYNNFFGNAAGYRNNIGSNNNFLGYNAGSYNTTGNNNTFIGHNSGISTSASNKIIFGGGYDPSNLFDSPDTTKDTQFAVGVRTDANPSKYWLVGNENFNVGIGTTNPQTKLEVGGVLGFGPGNNVRIGDNTTGASISSGTHNNFLGSYAGQSNTSGSYNNFFGSYAGQSNTSGSYNNFFGSYAGNSNVDGGHNNFLGYFAGWKNVDGFNNNFFGENSGQFNTSGSYNNFFGQNAGAQNTTGSGNNFIGAYAGSSFTHTGFGNNFIGYAAGTRTTSGNNSNIFGTDSGYNNSTGSYNNFFGKEAGYDNTTGSYNIFLGTYTGDSNTASNKVIIGRGHKVGFTRYPFDSPNIVKDTQLAIGIRTDANPSKYWLVGDENFNVGIGTTNPTTKLDVNGTVKATLFNGSGASLTNIPNGALDNSSVNFGGVTVSLGGTDATPAFNLADATGLPVSTGISGLGANVATFLATPSSSNLAAAVTGETGSGALVFATSPTLITPTLGTASATSINVSGVSTFSNNINIASGIITTTGSAGVGIGSFLRLKAWQPNEGGEAAWEYINGTTGYYLDVDDTNQFRFANYDATGVWKFLTNSIERVRIANSGNVGINTNNPTSTLTVQGNSLFTGILTARNATTQDSISLNGRAGGTSSFNLSLTPTTLAASRTVTFQDVSGTVYVSGGTDIPLADGGTNASLTASNGGIVYSTASAMAILSGTATAGQILRSGASGAPSWSTATFPNTATSTGTILRADGTNWVESTATYPTTTTANQILFSSAANTIAGITTANTAVLITNSSAVPSLLSGTTANRLLKTNGTAVSWSQASLTTDITGTLPIANGGTNSTSTPTNGGIAYGTGTAYALTSAGTAGQVLTSNGAGAPTWSSDLNLSGIITASSFVGNLTGTATTSTNINISATSTGDTTTHIVLVGDNTTGGQQPFIDNGSLTYNGSTNVLTAGGFSGDGSNLTALNAANISSGTIPGDRGVTSGSTSSSFIEYNGTTATSGQFDGGTTTPSGTTRLNYGGYLYATRFYGDGSNLTALNAANISSGTLAIARGGTNSTATPTNGGIAYGTGTAYAFTASGTAGKILTANGAAAPTWEDAPGGFSVTNNTSTNLTYYPVFVDVTTGDPTQTSVSSTKLNFNPSTGNFSSTQFTSLSDATKKTNIRPIENSIELTKQLEGVRFEWIDNNKPSLGLIAQEVEKVLPELVETNSEGIKSVSYGNIVGVLIEAIKEQQVRIEELERKLNV